MRAGADAGDSRGRSALKLAYEKAVGIYGGKTGSVLEARVPILGRRRTSALLDGQPRDPITGWQAPLCGNGPKGSEREACGH